MPIDDFITSALNLPADQIESISTVKDNGILNVYMTLKPKNCECPYCGGKTKSKGLKVRLIRTQDNAGLPTVIHWKQRRYACKDCSRTFMENNVLAPRNMTSTYSLLNQVVMDLRNIRLSLTEIAKRAHLSLSTVELYTDSFLRIPRQYLPHNLGIDELHSDMAKYGSSYLCILTDNDNRCLVDVLPSRSKHELSKYFEAIPKSERDAVLYVTMDIWQPYKDVIQKYCRNAVISVDSFHVIKNLSDGFSKFRIDIMNQQPYQSAGYYLLKKWHWLLEKDFDLDNEPQYNGYFRMKMNYREIYNLLLQINPELTLAYQLKELYRAFNQKATEFDCKDRFNLVLEEFIKSDLPCYRDFSQLLSTWKTEILNSFTRTAEDRRQSNALAENINGQLRVLIAVSNGYSNFLRFRARAIFGLNKHVTYTITDTLFSNKRTGTFRELYSK